jgi:hypothetical protein
MKDRKAAIRGLPGCWAGACWVAEDAAAAALLTSSDHLLLNSLLNVFFMPNRPSAA